LPTLADAEKYFKENVVHKDEWVNADTETKQAALNQAANQLYRYFQTYDAEKRPLPDEAIYEQALWILRKDDAIRQGEMGVQQVAVKGVSVLLAGSTRSISPEVFQIVGRRVGRAFV
jgi:hypothetical protein